MEKNVRWKHPDGAGGFTELNLPSSAEIVAYGAGTVKDELDNLSATTGVSAFMGKLFRANNAVEARSLLKVGREDFFDETGNRWNSTNAYLSTDAKKFGSRSMHTNGNGYLILPTPFTLGGKDFAVAFWFNPTLKSAASTFFFWGTTSGSVNINLIVQLTANNYFRFLDAHTGTKLGEYIATTAITAAWHHVELDYQQSSNTMYVFLDGVNVLSYNAATSCGTATSNVFILSAAKNGTAYYTGDIDEVLITEKLLHTSNFTPPSAPYNLDSDTLALLHFDTLDFFADDSGSYWLNLNAALSSTQKKFGSKSLDTSAGYLKKSALTLGGKDFAISAWFYSNKTITLAQGIIDWGDSANRLHIFRDASNNFSWNNMVNGTMTFSVAGADREPFPTGQWNHLEINYRQADNSLFLFLNGVLLDTRTETSFSTARTFPLYVGTGIPNCAHLNFNGYIDEVLVTEKLLHDADFTPPTDPHSADSDTLALLHFE